MRICLLSPYDSRLDEGMGNIGFHLYSHLSGTLDTIHMTVSRSSFPKPAFWNKVIKFHPDIIHVVSGPTINGLALLKALKLLTGAGTLASCTQPIFSGFSQRLIPFFKPDIVLTQSYESEKFFEAQGCRTIFMPAGVDTGRFIPVSPDKKLELRNKYNVPAGKFLLLSVAHIKANRNVTLLADLNRVKDVQALIIGGITSGEEPEIRRKLDNAGCIVWRKYLENIQEVYSMADCYVFPTTDRLGSIETPLSVLEAMSCNLPVISSRYGALPRLFSEGKGIWFADNKEAFGSILEKVMAANNIETRELVLPYSWEKIVPGLINIYSKLTTKTRDIKDQP